VKFSRLASYFERIEATTKRLEMFDIVADAVDGTIDSMPARKLKEIKVVREAVRRSVRAAVYEVWGKKPITKVLINVIDD